MKMILLLCITSMVDKNIIVNNPTLKGDSYFILADSKTQKEDEISNHDHHELFQQTRLYIDCNTPEKAVLSNSSDIFEENLSKNITDLKTEFLALKSVLSAFSVLSAALFAFIVRIVC